jgi:hypothetical protein
VRFSTNIFFLQHITISYRSDSSPKGKADNSSFVLQAMQQQFERLNFVLGEVRDKMDHQEVVIRNLQGGKIGGDLSLGLKMNMRMNEMVRMRKT